MIRFEGPRALDAEIAGLGRAERRQFRPELVEMQRRDLLIKMLGQRVDLAIIPALLGPKLDLRQGLIGERRRHHE